MQFIAKAIKWQEYQHYIFAVRISPERKKLLKTMGIIVFSNENTSYGLLRRLSIIQIVRKYNVDIIYGQNFTGNFWAFLGKIFSFRNPIFIAHEHGSSWGAKHLIRILSYLWASSCEKIICNSHAAETILKKTIYSNAPTITVYNGIDTIRFSNHPVNKISTMFYNILYVGRLENIKGIHTLIDAAEIIVSRFPEVLFTLVGDGSLRGKLERRIKKKGLSKNIILLGIRNDVPQLMLSSDLFVLPSIREPLGNVLLEAGLAKLPVISTKIDGIPEIIQHEINGLLIKPTVPVHYKNAARFVVTHKGTLEKPKAINPNDLVDKIVYLYKHRNIGKELGVNGNRLAKKYSITNYSKKIKEILDAK